MKKIIYIILIIFVLSTILYSNENITIPTDSIRFRIIANSNNQKDQKLKMTIKKELETNLFKLIENSKSKEETQRIIYENQDGIKETIEKYNVEYTLNYGQNHFPEKEYKGVIYEEGDYESLVISLGEAKGNNWWCVMYPPLCLLESTEENYDDVEYKFYIKEILDKIIN